MHRTMSLLATTALFILLLSSAATPTFAATCLFYTTKEACERFTDSGSCIWNAQAAVCLDGGPSLPRGTVGVAIVGLNPQSAPLELKPGPSVSFGNVSLGNDTEINVKFGDQKSIKRDEDRPEGESELEENIPEGNVEILTAAEAPASEVTVFCTMPPIMDAILPDGMDSLVPEVDDTAEDKSRQPEGWVDLGLQNLQVQ
ncbi:hypothetical protein NADE_002300 [Nannochloris sp. 'desiccata']|nr:hypothetical protein KSW81_003235 [Chlorella desiccata (nom. nud.)]KAH7625082.1 hypothetical protein NADE_002300 [Chlorella desiccata (nom. nud.)]